MRTIVDIAAHVLPRRYAAGLAGVDSPYWEDVAALTDLGVRLEVAEAAAARHGWPLHVIENARDDPAMEQPDAFLDALRSVPSRT